MCFLTEPVNDCDIHVLRDIPAGCHSLPAVAVQVVTAVIVFYFHPSQLMSQFCSSVHMYWGTGVRGSV